MWRQHRVSGDSSGGWWGAAVVSAKARGRSGEVEAEAETETVVQMRSSGVTTSDVSGVTQAVSGVTPGRAWCMPSRGGHATPVTPPRHPGLEGYPNATVTSDHRPVRLDLAESGDGRGCGFEIGHIGEDATERRGAR